MGSSMGSTPGSSCKTQLFALQNVLSSLSERKHEQSKLIGDDVDQQVQLYIREGGGNILARIVAAQGILEYHSKEDLAKLINRHWVYSLLERMNFVQCKAMTSKSNYTLADFELLRNRVDFERRKSYFSSCM